MSVRLPRDDQLTLVVAAKDHAAEAVVRVVLTHPDGAALPAWTPGAHIDLFLTPELIRQYSLCGDPTDHSRWEIGVLREPDGRGGSRHVHEALHVGDQVLVSAPRNNFELVTAAEYLFLAGGIGITPILPMVRAVEAAGARWRLVYGGRRRSSMAFLDSLAPHGDKVVVHPEDSHGLLDLDGLLGTARPGVAVYCCGPEGLLGAVESRCSGWPAGSLHVERFRARPVEDDGAGEGAEGTAAPSAFDVVLARSGRTVHVPASRSVLEVLEDAGMDVLSSCREGICGTCETAVVKGEPDHRDSLLTEDERATADFMMICVSRSRTPVLVLDL
ncbi:PDR/VanB family oxidoreductase [Frankia sp. Cppng1_Ct_nod]|uniref:PDR/VanB family oxidoreductase n=1 Tax=Frankia sp. Cppng1_Ct_nod TaxID=2897162 RepID=UPI0010418826|nr:PDR/VanB family oxidoreductase [Frankia sp. Cppng1_Ct_nod]